MNGYAASNSLSVRKNTYSGAKNSKISKAHNASGVASSKAFVASDRKAVTQSIGTREEYRVTSRSATVRSSGADTLPANTKNAGFVYVEHSGVAGTVKDVFYTKRVKSKSKSCFDKVVTILMFSVLLFFIAGSYCEYRDTFNEIKEMEAKMIECREEQAKLLMAIEQRDDLAEIEAYAVNNLGMVKSDKLTRHYVNISEKDVVTISEDTDATTPAQGVLLSGFKSIIANLIGQK